MSKLDGLPDNPHKSRWEQGRDKAPDPKPAAGETTNDTTCVTCGKPKFGPWSTIASGAVKDIQGYYCMCVQAFVGTVAAPSPASSPREPSPAEQSAMDAQDYLYPVMNRRLGAEASSPRYANYEKPETLHKLAAQLLAEAERWPDGRGRSTLIKSAKDIQTMAIIKELAQMNEDESGLYYSESLDAEKPEGERLGTCLKYFRDPHRQGSHEGICVNWQPIGLGRCGRVAGCSHDGWNIPHVRNDACWNWQPIAPEAAGGEKGKLQCEHGTFLDDHGCEKCDAGFCETKAAPAAPSGEQTREEIERQIDLEVMGHPSSDYKFLLTNARCELSTLRRERDQREEDRKRVQLAVNHELANIRADWNAALKRAETAEAQLRELAENKHHLMNLLAVIHRDGGHHAAEFGLKVSSELAEKAVIELRSTIERLEREAVKTLSTLKQIAACSCETGHTCVQIARELAERQLAELRSEKK